MLPSVCPPATGCVYPLACGIPEPPLSPSLCPAFLRSTNVTGESVGKTEAFGNPKRKKERNCTDGNNEGERIKRRENKGRQREMARAPGEKGGMIVCRGGRDNKSLSFISSARFLEGATQYLCYCGTSETHPAAAPRALRPPASLPPRPPRNSRPNCQTFFGCKIRRGCSPTLIDSFSAAARLSAERERERGRHLVFVCLVQERK